MGYFRDDNPCQCERLAVVMWAGDGKWESLKLKCDSYHTSYLLRTFDT